MYQFGQAVEALKTIRKFNQKINYCNTKNKNNNR